MDEEKKDADLVYLMPPAIQVAPFPYKFVRKSPFGIASLVLGIIAITTHWLVIFDWGLFVFPIPLILSCLAVGFGFPSGLKVLKAEDLSKEADRTGFTGLILGILTIMFSIAWLIFFQTYIWGWGV